MADLDERFRALDHLDAPELWPDATRRRPGAPPQPSRSRLVAAAVALAVATLATVFVVRAFGGSPSRTPVGESSSPSPAVTRCIQATAAGDFDGDGAVDEAQFVEVASGTVSCDETGPLFRHLASQELVVRFGTGATLREAFTDCQGGLCAYVFDAADLDGDGRDELAVDVSSSGAEGLEEFYRIDPTDIQPLVIAEPGDPPYVEPGPAILGGGFDSVLQSPVVCSLKEDGSRAVLSIHAENDGDSLAGPWRVHTTKMVLNGDRLLVTSTGEGESSFPGTSGIPSFSDTAPFDNGCG